MPAKKSLAMLLSSILMLGSTQLMAAPSASMLADTCAGCHGTDGSSMGPAIPNIAGMSAEYFNTVMKEYAEDERYSTIMGRIARGYTKEEIALMADHFAGKKYMSTNQNLDAAKVAAGGELYQKNCGKCHDENGCTGRVMTPVFWLASGCHIFSIPWKTSRPTSVLCRRR